MVSFDFSPDAEPPFAMPAAAGPRRITLLGATGSIGRSTLDLVGREPERFRIESMVAGRDLAGLVAAARSFRPARAVLADPSLHAALKDALAGTGIEAAAGPNAVLEAAAAPADLVVAAIVGAAGLGPTLAAVHAGLPIALATKECLVAAGRLFMAAAARHKARVLPLDSEHNAIFQGFEAGNAAAVERIVLTASGGPFRTATVAEMARATPEQALKHPNYAMGSRITIDSATLLNKGLEVIEAHHLFGIPGDRIDVLVHPQQLVHGMVAYGDGSLVAGLAAPDMRTPIAHCLNWPDRGRAPTRRLDLGEIGTLTFEKPDLVRFPALGLAYRALAAGGGASAVLNAADEVAVAAFLARRIGFLDIARLVEATLDRASAAGLFAEPADLDAVAMVDAQARRLADEILPHLAAKTG
ncbi:1-deoxy-D-xylulose-5-phosphate reductoisomerase [Prosthecomicrobium hirschii]|uniref:1-deoxy-D-xylulose-5-phosphate reductoisomerase n=1 Tax=Prosthecodimorpha hirschii TaxID=665126 RepID=UPI00222128F7|nr:1-deoxy-D-xylulose-5-phosphate reductoisomerase [Prosthecomicrobium hirschii]MCW1839843.1 1-deoxy-D-xylulose-5-phosphate reductoisomerase [Prosthecomicrobium hirschii]